MNWVEEWPPSYTRSWAGVVGRVEVSCHLDHDGLGVQGYHLPGSHGSKRHLSSLFLCAALSPALQLPQLLRLGYILLDCGCDQGAADHLLLPPGLRAL